LGLGLGTGLGGRGARRRNHRQCNRELALLSAAARLGLLPGLWATGGAGVPLGAYPGLWSGRQHRGMAGPPPAGMPAVLTPVSCHVTDKKPAGAIRRRRFFTNSARAVAAADVVEHGARGPAIEGKPVRLLIGTERRAGEHPGLAVDLVMVEAERG